MLKEATSKLDLFKGRKNKGGKIVKVRSVGCGFYNYDTNTYELHLNEFIRNNYILKPEANIAATNDYTIYQQSPYLKGLKQVGVGYLMNGHNAGLVQLEWEVCDSTDVYLDLAKLAAERKAA